MALAKDTRTQDIISRAIESYIEDETKNLVAEATERIKKQMEARTPEIIAGVTVAVMRMAQYEIMQDRVIFTIYDKTRPTTTPLEGKSDEV